MELGILTPAALFVPAKLTSLRSSDVSLRGSQPASLSVSWHRTSTTTSDVGLLSPAISEMGELGHREVQQPTQGHIDGKWQSPGVSPKQLELCRVLNLSCHAGNGPGSRACGQTLLEE